MTQQIVNIGTANKGNGDPLRTAFGKINSNFTELYTAIGNGSDLQIPSQTGNNGKYLTTNGSTLSWGDSLADRLVNGSKQVILNENGTLNVPYPSQDSFRIRLSSENFVPRQGKATLTLTGDAWDFYGAFAYSQDGQTELVVDSGPLPSLTNPGYEDGDTFEIDSTSHGIAGYVLTCTLYDVIQAGQAGWTANLTFSQPPAYPSTIASWGAIKVTSNENDWIFGTDGKLTIPGKIKHGITQLDLNEGNSGNIYLTTTTDDSTALFMTANSIQTYARQSVSLYAGTALGALQNTYDEQLIILNDAWQSVSENAGYPWGITQPLSQNTYNELIQLTPGTIGQGELNFVMVANSVRNAWTEWQNALDNTNFSIAAGNKSWTFDANGAITFPTLTVNLHNGGDQQGQVLQFSDPATQAIITGPTPVAGNTSQRLIIQGQRASGYGEGGDVYLWAGDSEVNGGDIKIYAGDADSQETGGGGYINIDAGRGFNSGGYLNLSAGNSTGGAGSYGGNVGIRAGQSYGGTPGDISLTTFTAAGSSHVWAFGIDGKLRLPAGGDITDSNGTSVLGGSNTDIYKFAYGIIGTKDNPDTGGWGGYNINLDPGGESWAGMYIPSVANQDSGVSLQIYSNKSASNNIQLILSSGNFTFNGNGTIGLPNDKIKAEKNRDLTIETEHLPTDPPATIVISGADFVAVNLTYTKDGANSIWYPAEYNPANDPYIEFTGGQYGIFVPGFGQALYVNTGTLNVPLAQWNTNPPLGSVAPTGVYTYPNSYTRSWQFGKDGAITTNDAFTIKTPSGTFIPSNWNGQGGWNQSLYHNLPTTGGSGSGMTVDVAANGGGYINITAITITNQGIGYAAGDVVTITNENNLSSTFTLVAVPNTWTFGTGGVLGLGQVGAIYANQTTGAITIADYLASDGTPAAPSTAVTVGGSTNAFAISSYGPPGVVWAFGKDGRTTFPTTGAPVHSTGVPGDQAGMVAFDSEYIYYCTADYTGTQYPAQTAIGDANGVDGGYLVPNSWQLPQTGWIIYYNNQTAVINQVNNGGNPGYYTIFTDTSLFIPANANFHYGPPSGDIWRRIGWPGQDNW